jgi:SH3 domain protein
LRKDNMHTNANRILSSNPIPALEKEPILRISVLLWLCSLVFSAASMAADIRYVGGQQSVPLSSGAGEDYPIVYRGLPPGTRLTVAGTSEDGLWADITTDNGITGWIPTRNLELEPAPQPGLPALAKPVQGPGAASIESASTVPVAAADPAELLNRINTCDAEFNTVAQELHQLKQVAGKAVQLDIDNQRLVEEAENLRSDVEMLRAENQRLLDNLDSEDFFNGALAVLLGVVIALVAPRLVPQRRKNSGWN